MLLVFFCFFGKEGTEGQGISEGGNILNDMEEQIYRLRWPV